MHSCWYAIFRLLSFITLLTSLTIIQARGQFIHRSYLGWIRDVATEPSPIAQWPDIHIDAGLERDWEQTFQTLKELHINEVVIWGIFVAREWPVDVETAIDDSRRKQVLALIRKAHAHKLKVLVGMGVYSWGFEAIIRAHPELAQGNASALCLHVLQSWYWQKRVLDYVYTFPIDGISLQSADQGRCQCDTCLKLTDAQYHAAVNQKVVQYLRQTHPNTLIGISGWGMDFSRPTDLPALVAMTRGVDYFVEVADGQTSITPAYRKQLIAAISPCAFGNTGTPNVEPPQHYARDRWFLPTARRAARNIQTLYRLGGRAIENYAHLLINPGDEASLRLIAALEQNPAADIDSAYRQVLVQQFKPNSKAAVDSLMALFTRAEDSYFQNRKRDQPGDIVRLEPLVSDHAGLPIYQTQDMTAEGRLRYLTDLRQLLPLAEKLREQVRQNDKLERILRGIQQMMAEKE